MMTEFCLAHGAPHAPNDCAECDGGERSMKSAKEWAESVIVGADRETGRVLSRLQDPDDDDLGAWLQKQDSWHAELQSAGDARGIIERLVERVQADARAPLAEEIARLKTRNDYVEGMAGAYESVIAGAAGRLSKALEPGADTTAYVKEVVAYLKALVTL